MHPVQIHQSPISAVARLWALLAVFAGAAAAQAQPADAPVYRCGNSYSAKPCPGATVVDVADPRSAAQQQDARQASQRDAALARQMTAERQAAERQNRSLPAANVGPVAAARAPAPAASKPHSSHAKKKRASGAKPSATKKAPKAP